MAHENRRAVKGAIRLLALLGFVAALAPADPAGAQTVSQSGPQAVPVDFAADIVQYEKDGQVLLASGNVVLASEGRSVRADMIRYDIAADRVEAKGAVRLVEANGDIFEADYLVLRNRLRDGAISSLQGRLRDDGRFWAQAGQKNGDVIRLEQGRYTPCKPCEEKAEKARAAGLPEPEPAWQIKAGSVEWDRADQTITYRDATFEVGGVPVFYTPYFRHPDGSVEQKSGLLRPAMGYQSQLGAFIDQRYYLALDPSQDATLGVIATSQENAAATAQYRRNFGPAVLEIDSSATSSSRIDDVGGAKLSRDDAFRGHVLANGRWDVNGNWRSGFDLGLTTDEQYMRQYDFDDSVENDDVLTSRLFAERFGENTYLRGRFMGFQDLRVSQFPGNDQPFILPEIAARWTGERGAFLGGRFEARGSFLSLMREGGGQDVNRLVARGEWERRLVSPGGIVTTVNTSLRGDTFITRDITPGAVNPATSENDEETRIFPRAHAVAQYPLARAVEGGRVVVEPVGALTLSPNLPEEDAIPNEDSVDTLLDVTNLFDSNRFTGLDRIEDGSRATYGVKTGFYSHQGDYADIFLGQSYRFDDNSNPFADGSGLSEQSSDYVGQIRTYFRDRYGLNYRFQYDGRSLQSRRHEVSADYTGTRLGLSGYYFFLDNVADTGFSGSREQLAASGSYRLNDRLRLRSHGVFDLGVDKDGLLRANVGFDYAAECYSFALTAERNLTDNSSGESDTSLTFRIGLKNLSQLEP